MLDNQNKIRRPVQVMLDTDSFIGPRPPGKRGPNKDFFQNQNSKFEQHKAKICESLTAVASKLKQKDESFGYLKVQVRREALGKSYRPVDCLFSKGNGFPLIGGGQQGEMHFQGSQESILNLEKIIESRAELYPRQVTGESGEVKNTVSRYRSEVGAIESLSLFDRSDKLTFSSKRAVEFLSRKSTIGGYIVELFRPDIREDKEFILAQIEKFVNQLEKAGPILAKPLIRYDPRELSAWMLELDLAPSGYEARINVKFMQIDNILCMMEEDSKLNWPAKRDRQPSNHHRLLEILANETIVKRVLLPAEHLSAPEHAIVRQRQITIPSPSDGQVYPIVGILDGGVKELSSLRKWCVGTAGPILPEDKTYDHGTFIAGLVVAGSLLNSHMQDRLEGQMCKYMDIPIFPPNHQLARYYKTELELFDELESAVETAKKKMDVRIFNLSHGVKGMRSRLEYSAHAVLLDKIARKHDVIFVVAAGNLNGQESRPEWPKTKLATLEMLALRGTRNEDIVAPADHLLGLTVGALNPPNVKSALEDRPANYTRRGPGQTEQENQT